MTDPDKRTEYLAEMELEKSGGVAAIQKRVEAEFMIPQAQQALKRRHYKVAYELYKQIEESLSDDGEIIADRAFAELMTLTESALKESKVNLKSRAAVLRQDLTRAIQLKPKYAPSFYYRGLLSKSQGALDQAMVDFKAALELNPHLAEASVEVRVMNMRSEKKK